VGEKVKVKPNVPTNQNQGRHHFLVNFLRPNFYAAYIGRAPWYLVLYSLWILIKDIWNKDYIRTNFVLFYEKQWPTNLKGHYKNFVDSSKASIAAGKVLKCSLAVNIDTFGKIASVTAIDV
jgi:hypothetical protein